MILDAILARMLARDFNDVVLTAGSPARALLTPGDQPAVLTGVPVMDQTELLAALHPLATPERWEKFAASQSASEETLTIPERNLLYTRRTLESLYAFGNSRFRLSVTFPGELRAHIRLLPDT